MTADFLKDYLPIILFLVIAFGLSCVFIILNYLDIASKKLEDLSEIEFLSEKNESLKKEISTNIIEGNDKEAINKKINNNYEKIIKEINENSNIQIIIKNKNGLSSRRTAE